MELERAIDYFKNDPQIMDNIVHWETRPKQVGSYGSIPDDLDPKLVTILKQMGIQKLYSHQLETWQQVRQGKHPVITTPTASGKTLAYLLPVLNDLVQDSNARALFIFPTKALAQDQWQILEQINRVGSLELKAYTYDGDTASNVRKTIRHVGQIVITNADMLHAGILPHHSQWVKLFENLRYIVVDELHTYKGIFGSHLANVFRRLNRILSFYKNNNCQFILSSATIANPLAHAKRIIGKSQHQLSLIDKNGAPHGERHILFYNPPVIQPELGIRRSSLKEAAYIGKNLVTAGISSIFFVRSRVRVEVLANYLRQAVRHQKNGVKAYRGGYLPQERRLIEQGLRTGTIHTVVSTNALELGVDIGSLDVAVSVGYPGSISSLWQQFGRAGRREKSSLALFIGSSSPLEQYFLNEPESLLQAPIEQALINPDNILIEMSHLKCAAFELPLSIEEKFGSLTIQDVAQYFADQGLVKQSGDRFFWSSSIYPANDISLRSASQENFVIINRETNKAIGEVDYYAAPTLIHEGAIYLHQGISFYIEKLEWEQRQAFAVVTKPDYFTDAEEKVEFQIIHEQTQLHFSDTQTSEEIEPPPLWRLTYGEIALHRQAVLYKKIKMYTHENIGWGKIYLPEIQMHTEACWMVFYENQINTLDNSLEISMETRGSILSGVAFLLSRLAPGYLMCDQNDLRAIAMLRSPFSEESTILFYDTFPGGVALCQRLFHLVPELLAAAFDVIQSCQCTSGCPSCIGPSASLEFHSLVPQTNIKKRTLDFLRVMLKHSQTQQLDHDLSDIQDFNKH